MEQREQVEAFREVGLCMSMAFAALAASGWLLSLADQSWGWEKVPLIRLLKTEHARSRRVAAPTSDHNPWQYASDYKTKTRASSSSAPLLHARPRHVDTAAARLSLIRALWRLIVDELHGAS